jgi:hypothetical protein
MEGVVVRDESGSPLVSDWSGSVGFAGVGRSRHQSIELADVLAPVPVGIAWHPYPHQLGLLPAVCGYSLPVAIFNVARHLA